jgi:general nucleoside transport system ATP-binding protein
MSRRPRTPQGAFSVEALNVTMRFGEFTALDDVSMKIEAGSFHALLGENGAGKSTIVKAIMGFYRATSGTVLVAGREVEMTDPKVAQGLGLGMVYQHFTLVPSLTAAENLVISRADAPAVINWKTERAALEAFMARMPFAVPLDQPVHRLAAGEKQKLEILKQLYLGHRFLILDEPTSVLTPAEADEVLGHVRALTRAGEVTVLMITHKFREVTAFADDLTVLRRGKRVGGGRVADLTPADMAGMMMGEAPKASTRQRAQTDGKVVLHLDGLQAMDRSGLKPIRIDGVTLRAGEILGVAGVSGNGQMELMEILTGQRHLTAGKVMLNGQPYSATRAEAKRHKVRYLPEEPLRNACAPRMSVAENLAFRSFDENGGAKPAFWKSNSAIARNAAVADLRRSTSRRRARRPGSRRCPVATSSGPCWRGS